MSFTSLPPLSSDQFAIVRDIFDRAVDLPPAQRGAFIDEVCPDDPVIRIHVHELLAADADVPGGDRFNPDCGGLAKQALSPSAASSEVDDPVPDRIGRYKVRRLIGRGGMGVVYLASQSDPDRQVALKILRVGPSAAALRTRFAREIRILGRLEHPGIARIYDAGTESLPGRTTSYFAMEYIRGLSLTEFAKVNELSVRDRLVLVAKVAEALQHAHTRGVLHRDLKPANILVAEADVEASAGSASRSAHHEPQPKILDFGVARILDPEVQQTAVSEQGLLLGTLAYMSPEQLAGDQDAVDTRSDIYALGVVLYELLAGRPPFDVAGKPVAEAARIIRDESPAPLSSGSAKVRIDRDVSTIVAKAMAKDKERRYATAAALAEDLRRHLASEPILARPPTLQYQLSRFARRHRPLVFAFSAFALAVVAGLIVSLTLFVREQQARERADREAALSSAIRTYMIDGLLLSAAPGRMGYDVKMLDVLSKTSDGLRQRFADHPEIEAEIRWDLGNVYDQLGKAKLALEQFEKALPLVEQTRGQNAVRAIGILGMMSQAHRQLQDPQRSLEAASEAARRAGVANLDSELVAVSAYSQNGAALLMLRRYDEAIASLKESLARAGRAKVPDESVILATLTWLQACENAKGNSAGALQHTREIAERTQKLYGRDNEPTIAARNNLVNALVKAKLFDEAAVAVVDLPEAAERTFPVGHPARVYCALAAAGVMHHTGKFEIADGYFRKAYDAATRTFDDLHWVTERVVQGARVNYAKWVGHEAELRSWSLKSARIRLMVANLDERATTVKTMEEIAQDLEQVGTADQRVGTLALVWSNRESLAPEGHPRRAVFMANLAIALMAGDARDLAAQAVALAEASLPTAQDRTTAETLIAGAKSELAKSR